MNSRVLLFWFMAIVLYFAWIQYIQWKFPPPPRGTTPETISKPESADGKAKTDQESTDGTDRKAGPAGESSTVSSDKAPNEKGAALGSDKAPAAPKVMEAPKIALRDELTLGEDVSVNPNTPYQIYARFTNEGAAVSYLQLNAFKNEKQNGPFVLLNSQKLDRTSFSIDVPEAKSDLFSARWEVKEAAPNKLTFRTTTLEGRVEVLKTFTLEPTDFSIGLELSFVNLTDKEIEPFVFVLRGPNAPTVEGLWYSMHFESLVAVMIRKSSGAITFEEKQALDLAKRVANGKELTPYANPDMPFQFVGLATPYFASVIIESDNPLEHRTIASATPLVLRRHIDRPQWSNLGIELKSVPISLLPKANASFKLDLFNGPKKKSVLQQGADKHLPELVHYPGLFYLIPTTQIALLLEWILATFFTFVRDYGVAIVLLTIVVRMCLFPISLKQARMAQKMTILQPKMAEIKDRYGDDRERYGKEVMALYAEHNVNPIGGCLPLLLQLPIFAGLYQALAYSFELRQAPLFYGYTWVKDLSAPDQLFPFGIDIPWLGPYFNLLPLISIGIMLYQFLVSSPPPTTPELKTQRQMMLIMFPMMGLMFYQVPAGLCLYFIANGLWSMFERQFLPKTKPVTPDGPTVSASTNGPAGVKHSSTTWITELKTKKKDKKTRR